MGLIEINIVYWNQSLISWPCCVIVHVCLQLFIVHLVYPIVQKWSVHPHVIKWFQCGLYTYLHIVWRQFLYTLWFYMVIVFIWSNCGLPFNDFNFYVWVRKNSCLYCLLFLFCATMLKLVRLQIILSCSQQNIFILVDKVFQHISVGLSRLVDRLFTNLLNINLTETRKKELSLQVRNNLEYSNSNLPN